MITHHTAAAAAAAAVVTCATRCRGEKYVQPDITAFQFEKVGDPYAPRVVVIQKKAVACGHPYPLALGV